MYAIFKTGGKQYRVEAGDIIRVEKLDVEAGKTITFDEVLAISDDKGLQTGTPFLDAASINANVLSQGKGDKVIIFKFKAKKDYRNKQGHRQPYTEIEIESIALGGKTLAKKEVKKEKPAKAKKAAKADEAPAEEAVAEVKEDAKAEEVVEVAEAAVEEVVEKKPAAKKAPAKKPAAKKDTEKKEPAEKKAPAKKPAAKKEKAEEADKTEE